MRLVYALYDNVSNHVMDYHIVDSSVWAERMFHKLMNEVRLGYPEEYSYRLICGLDGLDVVLKDDLEDLLGPNQYCPLFRGEDYVKMENDV